MEVIGEKSSCSNTNDHVHDQKVEPQSLLEESWFFGNLLNISASNKTKMSRCNSDPCPSTKYESCHGEMLVKNGEKCPTKLARAPSLPIYMVKTLEENEGKGRLGFSEGRKPNIGSSNSVRNNLMRAPSLPPPCATREDQEDEEEDQESEFTLGRLIRQASLNSSDILPPRRTSKVLYIRSSVTEFEIHL